MTGRVTLFSSPAVLAKTWRLNTSGEPVKETAAQMTTGTFEVLAFDSVQALAALLAGVSTCQAVSTSLPTRGAALQGAITTKRAGEPGALTRTRDSFNHLSGQVGAVVLDHDGSLSGFELLALVLKVCPGLSGAGVVARPSGSSHVWNGRTGEQITGSRGVHVWFMVQDIADTSRAIKTLAARLWLAGHGFVQVSSAGSALLRCPIDESTSQPARLLFAGGSVCEPPLEQRRGPPEVLQGGSFVDTRAAIPALSGDEQARFEALVDEAKLKAAPELAQKRAEHRAACISKRVPQLMSTGVGAGEAERRVSAAVDAAYAGFLLGDSLLTVVHDDGRHEEVSVHQILSNRDRWHEKDCLDPLNPGHRAGAADCRLFLHGTSPIAFSLDDGGKVYRLRPQGLRLVVQRGDRAGLVAALGSVVSDLDNVFRTDAGVVLMDGGRQVPLTVDRLMNLIGGLVQLVQKTDKGESPTDLQREAAVLLLASLN